MPNFDYRQNHYANDGFEPISPELLAAWKQFLLEQFYQGHDLFLTLNYNHSRAISDVHRDLRHLFARLNRSTLGPRWQTDELRWHGYAVIEHPDSNIHAHVLTRPALFCRNWNIERMTVAAKLAWKPIAPAGSIDLQPISKSPKRAISYLLKERGRGALTGLVII